MSASFVIFLDCIIAFTHNSKQEIQVTLKIALTGGIACGKTVISDNFKALKVPVIDTDIIARQVVAPSQPTLVKLVQVFGSRIMNPDGTLDRRALRLKAFGSSQALEQLNRIMHPAILEEMNHQLSLLDSTVPYALVVVPLLFELHWEKFFDRVIVADADEKTQLNRLILRDNIDEQTARMMIHSQMERSQRRNLGHDLIETDHLTLQEIQQVVINLHLRYINEFENRNSFSHV